MALAYSNLTIELKEIFLNNRPEELYTISPKGTVPVLYVNKSTIIDESIDIMKWALNHSDPDNWNDNNNNQNEIIESIDVEFKYWLDKYKYCDRYPEHDQNYYKEKCTIYLSKLESLLKTNNYLLSNNLLLVDVAIFPFIRQFANVNKNWFGRTYVELSRWLNTIHSTDLFLSVMDKYPEYQHGQNPVIINFNNH